MPVVAILSGDLAFEGLRISCSWCGFRDNPTLAWAPYKRTARTLLPSQTDYNSVKPTAFRFPKLLQRLRLSVC